MRDDRKQDERERGGMVCSKGPQVELETPGLCSEDTAPIHGTHALQTELLWRSEFVVNLHTVVLFTVSLSLSLME